MSILQDVREYVLNASRLYAQSAADHYDFWEQHIQFVVKEALYLAEQYGADREIVELGALLHDIALILKKGTRAEHHVNGRLAAEQVLSDLGYPADRKEKVLNCILHHRSSQNAENTEELCVADADILAHYDNIPMCFSVAYQSKITAIGDLKRYFSSDYEELSERTKSLFQERYERIMDVLFGSFSERGE